MGRIVAQEVSHQPVTMEAWIQFKATPCDICGAQSKNETGFY
jgi:hypothetical protein